ncbi:hypothetical protein M3Y94_00175900 [Aphelenchoides besseyi]|nr:hypothetical protein M3Y94_00175900 [Aphelenchoides besseyi]KAI6236930.1 hypothetical protein M3Y95_00211300 [Aphelenchoides besseyi]
MSHSLPQQNAMNNSIGTFPVQAEFPFLLLHAEIVRYFEEQEKERSIERDEWFKRVELSKVDGLTDNEKRVAKNLLIQGNAETRLEALGYRVGYALAERLSKDMPRIPSELENVKFICKEFWTNVFGKQVDNLRTNHEGIYVIQDNRFTMLSSFSDGTQYLKDSSIHLAFPSGLLRGALSNLGIEANVSATTERLPTVRFNVTIQKEETDIVQTD